MLLSLHRLPASEAPLTVTHDVERGGDKRRALIIRSSTMRLSNEAELSMALRQHGWPHVTAADFDDSAFTQARRVATLESSAGVVAAGRAWLAYLAFLPSDEQATALVEVFDGVRCSSGDAPSATLVKLADALLRKGRYTRVAAVLTRTVDGSNCSTLRDAPRSPCNGEQSVRPPSPSQCNTYNVPPMAVVAGLRAALPGYTGKGVTNVPLRL